MPAPIPEMIKQRVIQQWLQGLSRDDIARTSSVSAGAVSNIIMEWKLKAGEYDAEAFRELAKVLKSAGLSPAKCAIGLRMAKILEEQGMDVENYNIEGYINKKIAENRKLDERRQDMSQELSIMTKKEVEMARSYDSISEKRNKVSGEMDLFFEAKQELDKHELSLTQDIPKFAKTVKTISDLKHDPGMVLAEFEDLNYHECKKRALKIAADEANGDLAKIKQQISIVQQELSRQSFNLTVYDELKRFGFEAYELRRLLHTILNIAAKNGINYWEAVSKFFKDIEAQYDFKLGFESEIGRLEVENQTIKEKQNEMFESIRTQPFVGLTISRLFQLGLSEKDIIKLGEVFHGILNRTFSAQDLTQFAITTINMMTMMMTERTGTNPANNNEKNIDILNRAMNDLSKLEFHN